MDLDGWTGDGMRFDPSFTGGSSRREWIYCWYHSGKSHLPTAVFVQDYRFKVYEDGGIYDIASDQGEGNVIEEANISQETLRRIDNLQTVLENFRNDSL
jgi:hypothetical protein